MCNALIKKFSNNKAFSLIEMAVVLIILGLVIPFMIKGILQVRKIQAVETTQQNILEARNAIGDFRAAYGRYPCPARATAIAGDADYGYESRDVATGNCTEIALGVWRADSNNMALANRDVFIGTLPFRQMNLDERFAYDGYRNRMTYAVTGMLANDATYRNDRGGLSIVNAADTSLLDTPNSGHFALISHNIDDIGAVLREGTSMPCPAAGPQAENCNRDATFRADQVSDNFDDLVFYQISDSIEQWQISDDDSQDIHLKTADSFAVGINIAASTAGFVDAEVIETNPDDAVVTITSDPADATNTGASRVGNICNEDGTECFQSTLVAGSFDDGDTIQCPTGEFLVGVRNGTAFCQSEIFFSCPTGEFVTGFDATGNVVCSVLPPTACADTNLTTTCGDNRNITAFFSGGQWYGYGYSGQCYEIADLNTVALDGMATLTDVESYVDALNNAARNSVDCGPDGVSGLVRDTFECNVGVWNSSPVRTIEKLDPWIDLSGRTPLEASSPWPAETTGVAYSPVNPMSADSDNNDWNRDCWCREDYRVDRDVCSGAATGNRFRITKHNCPQTRHQWDQVYPASGWDDRDCGCATGTDVETPSCASHFGYTGIGITGDVVLTYNITCPGGASGTPVRTLDDVDLSACTCPDRAPNVRTVSCPTGEINSFEFEGVTYNNVSEIYKSEWSCPGGPAPVNPISSASEAGSYGPETLVHTQACACDFSDVLVDNEACPAGQEGTGTTWERPWNCTLGDYEPRSTTNIVGAPDCRTCIWQAGTPRSGVSSTATAFELGQGCPSCSGAQSCYDVVGSSQFKIYDGCYCAGQP